VAGGASAEGSPSKKEGARRPPFTVSWSHAIRPVLDDNHLGSDTLYIVMELERRRPKEKTC